MRTTTIFKYFRRSIAVFFLYSFAPFTAGAVEIGATAPDFQLPSLLDASKTVKLSEHYGKVVYLDFWSAWCQPCRDAMPRLLKLRASIPRQHLEIISINTDAVPTDALQFLQTMAVTHPVAVDIGTRTSTDYGLSTLPFGVLIDQSGVVQDFYRSANAESITALHDAIKKLAYQSNFKSPEGDVASSGSAQEPSTW